MVGRIAATVATLLALVSVGPANAGGIKPAALERGKQAQADFKAGKHDSAVAGFQVAYSLDPVPVFKWGVAKSHDAAGRQALADKQWSRARYHLEAARKHYTEFKAIKGLKGKARGFLPLATERLGRLKVDLATVDSEIAATKAQTVNDAAAEAKRKAAAEAKRKAAQAGKDVALVTPPKLVEPDGGSSEGDSDGTMLIAGAVVAGVGAAVVGVGAYFFLDAQSTRDSLSGMLDVKDAQGYVSGVTDATARRMISDADGAGLAGTLATAIGGAALLTGVMLIVLDATAGPAVDGEGSTTIGVGPLRGGAMMTTRMTF